MRAASSLRLAAACLTLTLTSSTLANPLLQRRDSPTNTTPSTSSSSSSSSTDATLPASSAFPVCDSPDASPFCLPERNSTLYVGSTYYVTWNPSFFRPNATITVILQWANNSRTPAWTSDFIANNIGYATITTLSDWLQPSNTALSVNLTFVASEWIQGSNTPARFYDGPTVVLTDMPAEHWQPPEHTKLPNKDGLMIGLPVALGFILIVVVGLFLGMRKHRQIDLGNIMSRSRGHVSRRTRGHRMRREKGHIRLEDRDGFSDERRYRDADVITPASQWGYGQRTQPEIRIHEHERDAFRQEIERQKF